MIPVTLIIETADIEIVGVRVFARRADADKVFDQLMWKWMSHEYEPAELVREVPGTVRLAGDDSYAVQMIETQTE